MGEVGFLSQIYLNWSSITIVKDTFNSIFVFILLFLTISLIFTGNTVFAEPKISSAGFTIDQLFIGNFGSSSMASISIIGKIFTEIFV